MLTGTIDYTLWADSQESGLTPNPKIPINELAFQDVSIQSSGIDEYKFAGRIRNKSKRYSLQSVDVRIVYYDCAERAAAGTCTVIGERNETIYLQIPPGQARPFNEPVYIYGDLLNVRGDFVWRYEVLSTKACMGK